MRTFLTPRRVPLRIPLQWIHQDSVIGAELFFGPVRRQKLTADHGAVLSTSQVDTAHPSDHGWHSFSDEAPAMIGPTENDRPTLPEVEFSKQAFGSRFDRRQKDASLEFRSVETAQRPVEGLSSYRDCPAFGLLQHAAERVPQRTALIYGAERWSYRDLNSDSVRCAAMLQRLGVRPGDRVGLLLPNVPEYIIAANGIWRAGGIVLAISPLMVADEVDALMKKTKCRHVICLDLLSHLLPDSGGESSSRDKAERTTLLVSIRKKLPAHEQLGYLLKRGYQWLRHRPHGDSDRVGWFWEEIATIERAWQPISIDPSSDPAYILPTGGTTGSPKAVTLSHQNMVANAWQQFEWTKRSFAEETMLGVLPFFHSYGMSATVMGGAAMAATLVLHHRFNTNKTIQLIETHKPTVFHAVPAMLVAINARLRENGSDKLDSLRWIISGGAPLEESVAREFTEHCSRIHEEDDGSPQRKIGPQVVEGFGLSEASPVTHVGHLFDRPIYGRIGLPLPMTECRIVDANAEIGEPPTELEDGLVGELCVRGPQVMIGYWGDPAATRVAVRNGWLYTGDLAVRHEDGWYSIVGRKKDLIITSGFNVYPSEVEAVLTEADGIKDVAVVAMRDEERGEAVHAFIVTEDGNPPDLEALDEFCRQKLSAYKRPRAYTHCESDLPRNFLGKVIRRELREQLSDGQTG